MDEKWMFVESCQDNYPAEMCKRAEMFQMISSSLFYLGSERNWSVERQWNIKEIEKGQNITV